MLKPWDVANVQVEELISAEALGCSQCTKVFPRKNKVWAHGPMSLKFDGPFL